LIKIKVPCEFCHETGKYKPTEYSVIGIHKFPIPPSEQKDEECFICKGKGYILYTSMDVFEMLAKRPKFDPNAVYYPDLSRRIISSVWKAALA
jgi:hypothetical protein